MVFRRMFKPRPAIQAGAALYGEAVAQARNPAFYAELGAPDTREGRFELYTLHVVLLLRRLKGHGEQASETAQGLFDAYIGGLDIALREIGVGDLSMAKKMKKLGQAFYGRLKAFDEAFAAEPDLAPLTDIFARTLLAEGGAPEPFVRYALEAERKLADTPLETFLSGHAAWPQVIL